MALRNLFDVPPDHHRKVDASELRLRNKRLVLRLVWSEGTISRAEIARRTGLSRSTVSAIVSDLIDTGLVSVRGAGDSRGGRRPIMLGFDDDALRLVGIDIGASHVAVAVTDLRLRIEHWVHQPHPVRSDPEGTLKLVERLVRGALAAVNVPLDGVVGLGVGVPSPVDPAAPGELSSIILPAWKGVGVQRRLEAALGRPVWVDNDANLGAVAELWWGAGKDGGDLTYVHVGAGIGAGHTIGGKLFRGARGVAGEIGHLPIDPRGPRCACGMNGCLVTLAGADALLEQLRRALGAGRSTELTPTATLADLAEAARDGDPLAVEIIADAGKTLGVAIASLLHLMSPTMVVLGGSLVAAGPALLNPVREALGGGRLGGDEERVVVGQLGGREVAIGGATLVMRKALDEPSFFPSLVRRRQAAS